MMDWLNANWGNIVVIAILAAMLTGAIVHLVRKKHKGCGCSCGCGCDCGCGGHENDSCLHKK